MQKLRCFIEKSAMREMKKRPAFVYKTDQRQTLYVYRDIKLNDENTLRIILADMGTTTPKNRYAMVKAVAEYFVFE